MKPIFDYIRRLPNVAKEITKERIKPKVVADSCPSTVLLLTSGYASLHPIAPSAHPLTLSCTPGKSNDTIIDDSRRLPNIAKETPKRQ
jgi:hypothetical protein